jgi:hypothetical protein
MTPHGGMAAMNPITPPTARAMDEAVGKTRARQDATQNRVQPSAKSTTLTNQATVTELPVLSTVKTMGATRASQGLAKPSNHMSLASATVPVAATQKATAPKRPASDASRMYRATKAINNSGNVMAYAPLNSWKAGSVIIAARSRGSDVDDDKQAACDDGDRPRMCAKR